MDDFEYAWDFGEVSELKSEVNELKGIRDKALNAMQYRLSELTKMYNLIKGKEEFRLSLLDYEARIDELESLLTYLSKESRGLQAYYQDYTR